MPPAKLRLGGPGDLLPSVLREARRGPGRAPPEELEGRVGSKLGGRQPCALAAQDASSISGLHEYGHSSGDGDKGYTPHSALAYLSTVSSFRTHSTGNASPLHGVTPSVSPSQKGGSGTSGPSAGAFLASHEGFLLPCSFCRVVCLQAGLSKKRLLQSALFHPVTHASHCRYHGVVSGFEVESFITRLELALSCSADRAGCVSTRGLISACAGGTTGKSLSINLDRLCRTNYCSANDRDNPPLICWVIHFTPVRIFKALISESQLGNY